MGWQELLHTDEVVTLPWIGGRFLRSATRTWFLAGTLPQEHGWYKFNSLKGATATTQRKTDPSVSQLTQEVRGYLVGDRLVTDDSRVYLNPSNIVKCSERVHLIEEGLDRFARIVAGRIYAEGPLIYKEPDMPLMGEDRVLQAYLDRCPSIDHIKHVPPALDAAFRMETYRRAQSEARRAELERIRAEEEEKRQKEARKKELFERAGDGAGRRNLARQDFDAAAKAALEVGQAEFLDSKTLRRNERAVKFRLDGRRFECTCDDNLQIVSAGICLTEDGISGDTWLTLESLPSVIREAIRTDRLVIYRHV